MDDKKRATVSLQIFLIVLAGFCVYLNSLRGEFIWDDHFFIRNNIYINDWSRLLGIFTGNLNTGFHVQGTFYRPLQLFTYMLDYSIWGLNTFGYHLMNILLHIIVGLLIYHLITILFNNQSLSLLTSLLFLVHPVQVDAVSYISGRGDLLSAIFILLCSIFYIKSLHQEKIAFLISVYLSCILALLSKENALILPLLLLLFNYVLKKKINFRLYLPILFISGLYVLFKLTTLKFLYQGYDVVLKRIPGFFVALTNYFRILLFPFDLHMEYCNPAFSIAEPKALFGLLTFLLLIIYAFIKRNNNRILFFSIFWFFISILPTTSIYPINAFYMAEHWLYLPSVGFFLIFIDTLISLYKKPKLKYLISCFIFFIIIFYSYLTIKQNKYWQKEIDFYQRTLIYSPCSANAHNNLGSAYLRKEESEKAIVHFKKAIEINPKMAIAHYNLGSVYLKVKDEEKATGHYKKAIEIRPDYKEAYYVLCDFYAKKGKDEEAVEFCKKTIQQDSQNESAYYNLANAHYNLKDKQESIEAFLKAIEIEPTYIEAYNNLAALYIEMGRIDEAIDLWNKAIRIKPDFATAHFNLAIFYFQKGKYDLAIQHCDKVISLGYKVDPKFLRELQPYR